MCVVCCRWIGDPRYWKAVPGPHGRVSESILGEVHLAAVFAGCQSRGAIGELEDKVRDGMCEDGLAFQERLGKTVSDDERLDESTRKDCREVASNEQPEKEEAHTTECRVHASDVDQ